MKEIFFLIRLPFFLLGLTAVTVFVMPFMLLFFIWGMVKLPFVFISCAFANDTYPFRDHKREYFDPSVYAEPYTGLWRWLEG
jgi:hypothetical protein